MNQESKTLAPPSPIGQLKALNSFVDRQAVEILRSSLDSIGFYTAIFLPMVLATMAYFVFFYDTGREQMDTTAEHIFFFMKFFWFSGLLIVFTNLVGLIRYGSPHDTDRENVIAYRRQGWNYDKRLRILWTARGDNWEALGRAIAASRAVLDDMGVEYRLDVITAIPVSENLAHLPNVNFYVEPSPDEYQTKNNAKYKARGLQYMVEVRRAEARGNLDENTWILHMDEESTVSREVVAGIHQFINDEKNQKRIGQGEIKYNAYNYGAHVPITIVDSLRTGDDLGRFRFQFKMFDRPLFGMHGSFILVQETTEDEVEFDLSVKGSITEDAYFALTAADRGYKFGWVDGHIREQSPFTVEAIMKQRRRWFCGLLYLSFDPEVSFRNRFFLMLNMLFWGVAWVGTIVAIVNIFVGGYYPLELALAAALMQGAYVSVYAVGAYRNLLDAPMSIAKKVTLFFTTCILVPIASVIEGISVLYALLRPVKHFDVVKK